MTRPYLIARQAVYDKLITTTASTPNQHYLATLIASWCLGHSVLPDYLGLACHDFHALKNHYFPHFALPEKAVSGKTLDFSRMLEKDDLTELLRFYSIDTIDSAWIIDILVAGCLGDDHLWHDLGLWSRTQLSALLQHNFPNLAAKNTHDMKWKKFLYKQLCEQQGLYICRAPSCNVCADYQHCYGSEESQSLLKLVA